MITLAIVIEDKRWRKIPRLEAQFRRVARAAEGYLPQSLRGRWEATVLLTDDAALRRLNRAFRGKDKPTNVLSFPAWGKKELARKRQKTRAAALGDIALGYQYVAGEAKKDNKLLANHAAHLLLHGVLHLFGYDHMHSKDAARMERLEQKIMAALGLPDPYATARTGGRTKR